MPLLGYFCFCCWRGLVRFNVRKDLSLLRKLPLLSSSKITKNSIKIPMKMQYTYLNISLQKRNVGTGSFYTHDVLSKRSVSMIYNVTTIKLIYTASKVKHHLNIFQEKTVKLSKHEFILVTFLKRNKVVTIYSKF